MIARISDSQATEITQRIEAMIHQVRGLKRRVSALETAELPVDQPARKGR
jgi:hypothetical protein